MDARPKENAVKQEIERMDEAKRGVIRLSLDALKKYPGGISKEWTDWWNQVRQDHPQLLKAAEAEGFGFD
jgi:cullin-associated NEDD8-dissociated protein 1